MQLDSFNNFILFGLQNIIDEDPELVVQIGKNSQYIARYSDVSVDTPYIIEADRSIRQITPNEARLRDLTYDAPVCVNVHTMLLENGEIIEKEKHNKIPLARIPIMLKSIKCNLYGNNSKINIKHGECELDPGGYFIIKGKERVLITQERVSYNTVFVFAQKPNSKHKHVAEIRSMSEETGHSIMIQAKILPNGKGLSFSLPYITQEIPAGIVFKAMGIDTDEDIKKILVESDINRSFVCDIIQDSKIIDTKEDALNYIGKSAMHVLPKEKREVYASQMLCNELFPHLGTTCSIINKALFLGYMLNKLISTHLGERTEDDRDHVSTKRLETAGILIGDIFRSLFKRNNNMIKQYLQKRQEIVPAISRTNQITNGIRHCFATGNWGVQKTAYIRTGVSQVASRLTWGAVLSHLKRIVIPIGKEGKNTKIRQIHSSQFGHICPSETPEGQSSGIVKNFAFLTEVTNPISGLHIRSILDKYQEIIHINNVNLSDFDFNLNNLNKYYKILVNGIWYGLVEDTNIFIDKFIKDRNKGLIPKRVSISYNKVDKEILIYSDEGRMVRPLFKLENNKLMFKEEEQLTWTQLIEKNHIVYLDSYEIDNQVIATSISDITENFQNRHFDYCEIHASMILGTMASMIPYPDHTQSPRNCYQAAMGKQALGVFSLSHEQRTDTVVHLLQYPQKPLVYTHASDCMGFNQMPSGINAIVAIASYTGFNQEDSVLLNQNSIDKGLFRSFVYKTIMAEEKKRAASSFENITVPPESVRIKSYNYQKLDKNGIIYEGKKVKIGDVIIGKIINKSNKSTGEQVIDNSIVIKHGEEGVIDKVFISVTPDGYKLVKVKIRSQRIPEIGDKFASRHAQKGTCGMVLKHEDMPFTQDGIVPDIVVNPHALPSRMTINMFLECLGSKSAVHKGIFRDCTAFSESSTGIVDHLMKELGDLGFEDNGFQTMYSGYTGEEINAKIFIGPIYYQRLKHLVADKIHARDSGNVQSLTRQPLEGRSREGGLRFGEMERDCMISHGVSAFLKERLFNMSDKYCVNLCADCGQIVVTDKQCKVCGSDNIKELITVCL